MTLDRPAVHNLLALANGDHGPAHTRLRDSISEHGLAVFDEHGIDPELLALLQRYLNRFYAQPLVIKQGYELPDIGRQRGYTSPQTEHARDKSPELADLKEYWHEGPPYGELIGLHANLITDWPGFDDVRRRMHSELRTRVDIVLRAIAPLLGVSPEWLVKYASGGDDLVRFLRYPALRGQKFKPGAKRASEHTDTNFITALLSKGKGLVARTMQGRRLELDIGPQQLVVQMGDFMGVLSGGLLPATLHWVENPEEQDTVRDSIAFFNHPNGLHCLDVLPHRRRDDFVWDPCTERAATEKRLVEIGILDASKVKYANEFASRGYHFPSPWPNHI